MKTYREILSEEGGAWTKERHGGTKTNVPIGKYFKHAYVYAIFNEPPKKYQRKIKLSIDEITPVQPDVNQTGVEWYAKNGFKKLPIVVKINDGRYLALNHTRICAQVFNGKKMIDVLVAGYDIEKPGRSQWYKVEK